jgi:hydroxyacylglutathione hydrolase
MNTSIFTHSHDGFIVLQLPVLRDNYIYMVLPSGQSSAWVIDPADAATVIQTCRDTQRSLSHIWNTHHHWDHTDGNSALVERYDCAVYAAASEATRIPQITHALHDHDECTFHGLTVNVLAVPGHTDGHLAFVVGDALFCGDVLFSAGCGRLFEGTPAQMLHSLQRLMALGDNINIYCAHEYTAMNIEFALAVADSLHDDGYLQHCLARQLAVTTMRHQQHPSVPLRMAEERLFNPFLQVWNHAFSHSYANIHGTENTPLAVFTHLRQWRNNFVSHDHE